MRIGNMARNVEFHLGLILVVISYSAAIVGTSGYGYPQQSYQTYDKRVIEGYGHGHGHSHGHGGFSHGHYGYGRSAKNAPASAGAAPVSAPRGTLHNGYTKGPSYDKKPTGVSYQKRDGYGFYDSYTKQPKSSYSGIRSGSYSPATTALAAYKPSRALNYNPSPKYNAPTAKSAYTPGSYQPSPGYRSNSLYKTTPYIRRPSYVSKPSSSYSSGSGSGSGYTPRNSYSSVPSYTQSRSSYSPAASPSYGAASPSYGAASPSYGAGSPSYGSGSPSYGSGTGARYTSTLPSTSYSQLSPASSSNTRYSQVSSAKGPLASAQKSFGHGHGHGGGGYGYDPCSKLPEGDYVLEGQFRSLFPYADPQCNFVKCANYKAYVNPCAIGTKNDGYGKGFCYYHDLHKYCGYPKKQTKRYY